MFSQVTVTQVAALLVVVSALFALALLFGIPRGVRNGPGRSGFGTVGFSVLLCLGNIGLVVVFLQIAVQCFSFRIDPPLFEFGLFPTRLPTTLLCGGPQCDAGRDPNRDAVWSTQEYLIVSLICYTVSLAVLAIEMSAGRSRRQRRSASSK